MSYSIATTTEHFCRHCGKAFVAEIWLVVATDERPDLVEQIKTDSLHDVYCTFCGYVESMDVPLLIFRTHSSAPFLFSPAQFTTSEEDQEDYYQLLAMLHKKLADQWQDQWHHQEPLVIHRESLPDILAESAVPVAILDSLQKLISAGSWQETQRILTAHPELLDDDADRLLGWMLEQAQDDPDTDVQHVLKRQRIIFDLCRRFGIEQAIRMCQVSDEVIHADQLLLSFINAGSWIEKSQLIVENPGLLTDEVDRMLMDRIEEYRGKEEYSTLEMNLALLRRCRTMDLDHAFVYEIRKYSHEQMDIDDPSSYLPELSYVLQLLFSDERVTDQDRRIVLFNLALDYLDRSQHPLQWATLQMGLGDTYLLYGSMADAELTLSDSTEAKQPASVLVAPSLADDEEHIELAIQHYLQATQVFTPENSVNSWCATHSNLATGYTKRNRGIRTENLEGAVCHYEQALKCIDSEEKRAGIHYNLALVYDEFLQEGQAQKLEPLIYHFEQALKAFTKERHPSRWSDIHLQLGAAYQRRTQGNPDDNQEKEIYHFEQAITVSSSTVGVGLYVATLHALVALYTERKIGERSQNIERAIHYAEKAMGFDPSIDDPFQWALTRCLLASAYGKRTQDSQAENTENAITHYEQALTVYTHKNKPETWVKIQFDLAKAYRERIHGDHIDNAEKAISHFHNALIVYTQDSFPEEWAETHLLLGDIYSKRNHGEERSNVENAMLHYEAALQIYTAQGKPELWIACHNNLATACLRRSWTARGENARQASEHYNQALQIATQDHMPTLWASLQHNLAEATITSTHGSQAENIEKAINHGQLALTVFTSESHPEDWAMTHQNLAAAYYRRLRGRQQDNIELTLHHSKQALEIYTEQSYPDEWASLQHNLGIAYQDRVEGEPAENIELAILHCQNALHYYIPDKFPKEWARTQNTLADAYQDRLDGKHAENMEYKIRLHEKVLSVITREVFPELWADTQLRLALAFKTRKQGNRADNLECAIEHGEATFKVYTQDSHREKWAGAKDHLATIYVDRQRGNSSHNIERAISYCKEALSVFTRETSAREWASVHNNLTFAYNDRILGDRAENIERAIYHGKESLLVYTRETFPYQWSRVQLNLAKSYATRVRGAAADNQARAIDHYQQRLEVCTQESYPEEWALTHYNLALAFNKRIQGDPPTNREHARNHAKQALLVYTQENHPIDWARAQHMLADTYLAGIHREPGTDLECAIFHYQKALLVRNDDNVPIDYANSLNNLALAYSSRLQGNRTENLKQAVQYFSQALQVYDPVIFSEHHRQTQNNLANMQFRHENWADAAVAYQRGLEAAETLYLAAITPETRRAELQKIQDTTANVAYSLAKSGRNVHDLEEAAVLLERNRARWLAESLALRSEKPETVPVMLWQRFAETAAQTKQLLAEAQLPDDTPDKRNFLTLSPLLTESRATLSRLVEEIREHAPEFMPLPNFDDIQAGFLATKSDRQTEVGVYIIVTSHGGLALIVHGDCVTKVWLDLLTEGKSRDLLFDWFDAYSTFLSQHTNDARKAWFDQIDEVTRQLWELAMGPITAAMKDLDWVSQEPKRPPVVNLIPTGLLALLPLHAAWAEDATTPTGRHYFLDDYAMRYAPSATVLRHCRERGGDVSMELLLALDEPKPIRGGGPLPNSAREVKAIASLFPTTTVFQHEQASRAATLDTLATAQVAHFSCHGTNNWQNPLDSGLLLANDELLTVRDFLELHLPGARLATLSACETGIVGTDLPDEVIMLPSALVQAGYAGVVASLWSVADVSTAMLMVRFYQYWREEGLEPVYALRAAQRWVRDTTNGEKAAYFFQFVQEPTGQIPATIAAEFYRDILFSDAMRIDGPDGRSFAHPFWWAAFYLTGI